MNILLTSFIPFIAALPMLLKPSRSICIFVLLSVAVINVILSTMGLFHFINHGEVFYLGEKYFIYDEASSLFLCLISVVFLGVSIHVTNRTAYSPLAAKNIAKYSTLSMLFLSVISFSILSNHLLLTWACLETSTLVITPLIHYQKTESSYKAAWRYLLFSSVSLMFVFFGLDCIARGLSPRWTLGGVSFLMDDLLLNVNNQVGLWERIGFGLVIFGYASKLGLAPLYSWLPETYDEAPPSVSVLLSAVQFNAVVLALFRVISVFRLTQGNVILYELVIMGVLSMIVATANMITTTNYKRLIAYAAINHAGVMSIGLGIGASAAYGTVLYIFSNAFVKAILFLTAGNIKSAVLTKEASSVKGLIRSLPYNGFFLMIGIWALLGFAPFGSFLGEVIIMNGIIQTGHYLLFGGFCTLLVIAFVATGRTMFPMIWGDHNSSLLEKKESFLSILPSIIFLVLLLSLGVYLPESINNCLLKIAALFGGV